MVSSMSRSPHVAEGPTGHQPAVWPGPSIAKEMRGGLRLGSQYVVVENRAERHPGSIFGCPQSVVRLGRIFFDFKGERHGPPEALVRCNDDDGFRIQQFESRACDVHLPQ